jgi:hypothetical protein
MQPACVIPSHAHQSQHKGPYGNHAQHAAPAGPGSGAAFDRDGRIFIAWIDGRNELAEPADEVRGRVKLEP